MASSDRAPEAFLDRDFENKAILYKVSLLSTFSKIFFVSETGVLSKTFAIFFKGVNCSASLRSAKTSFSSSVLEVVLKTLSAVSLTKS